MTAPASLPAPRRLVRRQRGFPDWLVSILAVLSVAAFLLFLCANAVESKLLQADYYDGVLVHADAYNRAYSQLGTDPGLSPQVSGLLGGEDLSFVDDIPGELLGAVPKDDLLRRIVKESFKRIIQYIKDEDHLDLTLDVTDVYAGVGLAQFFGADFGSVFDFAGGEPSPEVEAIPTKRAASYDDFKAQLEQLVDAAREGRTLPATIPTSRVGESRYDDVEQVLVDRSGLSDDPDRNGEAIDDIRDAVEDGETTDAIRLALTAITATPTEEAPNDAPAPAQDLLGGEFVTQRTANGETHYFLGPPEDIRRDIEDAFSTVHLISWMAPYGRATAIILLVLGLGAIMYLRRARPAVAARWVGGVLVAGGAIGFLGWLIGRQLVQDKLLSVTLGDSSGVPESLQQLWRDVVHQAGSDLTPAFWVPSLVAFLVGALLIGLTFANRLQSRRKAAI